MASQRQHRSRLAERLGKLRRALGRGTVLVGSVLVGSVLGLGLATPVNASVQIERQALEARVQAVRAMLQEPAATDVIGNPGDPGSVAGEAAPLRTAQWFNWNNWNNWNNWKNWGNWLNR